MSPHWWGPQQKILQLWFRKTIWYKVQVIHYQNNSNNPRDVRCTASKNKRHGHYLGQGPCNQLWLGPCPCFMAIPVSLGTAGGMSHWRQQQDYPRAVLCSQVSPWHSGSAQWAVLSCQCAALAAIPKTGSSHFQLLWWLSLGCHNGHSPERGRGCSAERAEPGVTGLSPGSAVSALSPCCREPGLGSRGAAPAQHWLQSCSHGTRVTLVFCKLWGCRSARDTVSIPLFSLVVLCCNLPGDKHHLNKAEKLDWSSCRCLSRCFS